MRILHVTDAAAAGVLASVTMLARAQAADPNVDGVRFGYTPRPDSPSHTSIADAMGDGVDVCRWSLTPRTALSGLVRGLLRELARDEIDVIHLHSSRAGFLGRVIATVLRPRAHIVYSPHGFAFNRTDFTALETSVYLGMERWALHGGRDLILVSDGEAAVASSNLKHARTAVLCNVVDTSVFASPPEDLGTVPDVLKIVHVGRITGQKEPAVFTQIAAKANRAHPGRFDFTWIGDGDRQLLQLDAPGNADAAVDVTGWVTSDEIRPHLAQASAMLFTSVGEGMPISLLEAASMGIPTVGSDVVGVRDLIAHGTDGFLFTTVAQAVSALERLLDVEVRSELGAAARSRAASGHSQAELSQRSLSVYRGFLMHTVPSAATADSVEHAPPTGDTGRRS